MGDARAGEARHPPRKGEIPLLLSTIVDRFLWANSNVCRRIRRDSSGASSDPGWLSPNIEAMQDLRRASQTRGARLVLAAVAVALFGLLSMHGWGSHASTHIVGAVSHGVSIVAPAGHGDVHGLSPLSGEGATDQSRTHTTAQTPGAPFDGVDGDLLGLCLAILSGLILAVALLMARRGIQILCTLLPAWPNPVFYGRDRDPPDLLQLCVIRC